MRRRSMLITCLSVLHGTSVLASTPETPESAISAFIEGLKNGHSGRAARAFYPELRADSETVASIEHSLDLLFQEVGSLQALRQIRLPTDGMTVTTRIARRVALSDTRQVVKTIQSIWRGPSKRGVDLIYVVAAEASPTGWRIRELVVHFPPDYPDLPGVLQRLAPLNALAPRNI